MVAKLHLRKQSNGNVYIQGVIPASQVYDIEYVDQIASADIILAIVKDRTKEYAGKSNISIIEEGMP